MRIQQVGADVLLDDDLVLVGDNKLALPKLPPASFDLIYMDPPFNTGRAQARQTLRAQRDRNGDRTGFGGRTYRMTVLQTLAYDDQFADYLAFLEPRLTR